MKNYRVIFAILILAYVQLSSCQFGSDSNGKGFFVKDNEKPSFDRTCFCKLNGDVNDCDCQVESIDKFNNYKIYPRLNALVQKDYFRYIKLNLKKSCQFWPSNDGKCAMKGCQVEMCNEEDLPQDFKTYFENDQNHNPSASVQDENQEECEESNPLGHINQTLTDENLETLKELEKFDDAQENFCESDEESMELGEFVDLITNPERFTGYKGEHAHRMWNSIYNENCFGDVDLISPYGPESETCLEKRVFYRLISGLHASINIHLTAHYRHKGHLNQPDYWGPNIKEFKRRFSPAKTNGQGPQWLKNLYFVYLVELRAITKAAPYFEKETFYAGRSVKSDQETKQAVLDFLNVTKEFKSHFDESTLFKGNTKETLKFKEQFSSKFRNITRIMDCVGCDKCKLWGKVQTRALGTALKILLSGKRSGLDSTVNADSKQTFQLSRVEIVSLFNGFARLSSSINQIEEFRELLLKQSSNKISDPMKARLKIDNPI